MNKKLAPIVLFCYNRLDVLKKTVKALQNNVLSQKSDLIIFSDGPKEGQDEGVDSVRRFIKSIDGFKSVKIVESPINKGLANSIIDGVTKVVNEYGKIIVLEDDIVTSPYFLNYMNDALEMYKNEDDVACITGYNFPIKNFLFAPKTFFVKSLSCWSWATWKNRWDLFESDGQKLLDELEANNLGYDFDIYGTYPYKKMLKEQIEGKNSSWDIRWYASFYLKDKLCLYPFKPFAENIGFGENATHCKNKTNDFDVKLNLKPIKLKKIKISENTNMKKRFAILFNKLRHKNKNSWYENIFSIKSDKKSHKVITILGIKIKIRKNSEV